jgi:hypothetical protein
MNVVGRYRQEELVGQAFGINVQVLPDLIEALGVPLTLAMGW